MPLGVSSSVPACDPSTEIGRIRTIFVGLLFLLPACAGSAGPDTGSCVGGGPCDRATSDAAAVDAGALPDAAADPSSIPDAAAGPLLDNESLAGACFNGLDDDGDHTTDCGDAECGTSAYCCVGVTSSDCCTGAGPAASADFSACAGIDPRVCSAGEPFESFGAPLPSLEAGAFLPNGDGFGDSGLILGPPVDPASHRVRLEARIAAPVDGCGDCLDVIALGLADPIAPGAELRVFPDVAFMVRASRMDFALMVAGEVVASEPLLDSDFHRYLLEIDPDGSVALSVDSIERATARVDALAAGRAPLLFGRTLNRDGVSEHTRASSVSVTTLACDIPSALERDPTSAIPAGDWGLSGPSDPSVLAEGAERVAAFTSAGDVYLARRSADGVWSLGASGAPVLVAAAGESLQHPELLREADRYVFYVTRASASGTSLARAEGALGHAESFSDLTLVVLPADARDVEAPSLVRFAGALRMAVKVTHQGSPAIVLLDAEDPAGTRFVWTGGRIEDSIVVRASTDRARFDSDEVSDPELVEDGARLLRLYYAGRRGTRWALGSRVAGNLSTWRAPLEDAVLSASRAGHDSLWVRHPSAVFSDGQLELFYTAFDGVRFDVGRATGVLP